MVGSRGIFNFAPTRQVDALAVYADRMDDELRAGDLLLGRLGSALFLDRVAVVDKVVAQRLSTPFDFSREEFLETDPDKRAELIEAHMDSMKEMMQMTKKMHSGKGMMDKGEMGKGMKMDQMTHDRAAGEEAPMLQEQHHEQTATD